MTAIGVYTGNNPDQILQYENWLGQKISYIAAHSGRADWADWTSSISWLVKQFSGLDNQIHWTIPMFADQGNLTAAAKGEYDSYYTKAAQILANAYPNEDKIVIRVGVEFNGDWMPWAAAGHEHEFIEAYRNFVDALRTVSDKFVFEWNVNVGDFGMNPADAYPGDDYVDIIGMDFYYNQWVSSDPVKAWDYMVHQTYGLQWLEDFAAAHGKPTGYSEWGVQYDNAAAYIASAADWFASHDVAYAIYWDSNAAFQGKLSSGQYPTTAAAFLAEFGSTSRTNDLLTGTAGADVLNGGAGNDVLIGGLGADTLSGGADIDTADYSTGNGGVTVNLATGVGSGGHAQGDTLSGIENLTGSIYADNLNGDSGANVLDGGNGNDYLAGGGGNDTLYGGNGNDTLDGGSGRDTVVGGKGNDTYCVDSATEVVVESPGEGTDLVRSGVSFALPDNVENLELIWSSWVSGTGNALDNRITGNAGDNLLRGLDGNDYLDGAAGSDTLEGGNGNDALFGGFGNDKLVGGTGADVLYGGSGNDTFVFRTLTDSTVAAPDRIMDLSAGDKVDLSVIDADTTVTGDQAFALVARFTGHPGEATLHNAAASGYTALSLDVNGNGESDMSILILGNVQTFNGWIL